MPRLAALAAIVALLGVSTCALSAYADSSTEPSQGGMTGGPLLPEPAADFYMTTLNNVTYAFLQSETAMWKPSLPQWKSVAEPIPFSAAGAPVDKYIVLVGGVGHSMSSNCSLFDTTSNSFSSCAPMPTGRSLLGAASVNSILYAVGGYAAPGWNVVEAFDYRQDLWKTGLPPLPTPRYGLSVVAANQKLYAIGGVAWHMPAASVVEVFDVASNTWSTGPAMPGPRAWMGAATVGNAIYVAAGSNGVEPLSDVMMLDIAAGTWTTVSQLPPPSVSHLAAAAVQGWFFMAGGTTGTGFNQRDLVNTFIYQP